jgi:uncharacterized repeat protein (TIGR01451 family)
LPDHYRPAELSPPARATRLRRRVTVTALLALLAATSSARADIAVAKAFLTSVGGPAAGLVRQGDVVVLAITTLNDSTLVTNGSLTDTLPAGMVIAVNPAVQFSPGCGPATASPAPGDTSFTFTNAEIPAAANSVTGQCTAYVSVQVIGPTGTAAGSTATLNNTIPAFAYTGSQGGAPVTNQNPVTQSISVSKLQNLTVAKAFAPSTVPMGEPTTVTITVGNPNASSAVGLSALTDTLPANLSAAGADATVVCSAGGTPASATTATGSGTSGTVTFTMPAGTTIAAGGTCTLTWPNVVAALAQTNGGVTTNRVLANAVANDRGLQSPAAAANLNVQPPLQLSKNFVPGTVPANTPFNLNLVFRNPSASALSAIALSDALPTATSAGGGTGTMTVAGAATTSGSCGGFSVGAAPGDTSITVASTSLGAGQSCTVTIPVTASTDGVYANTTSTATYTSANPAIAGPNTVPAASANVTVYNALTMSKSAQDPRNPSNPAGSVAPGNLLAYRLTLNNYSTSPQAGVDVIDPLPVSGAAQVTFKAAPAPVFSGCTGSTSSADGASTAHFSAIAIPAASGTSPAVCTITFYTQVPANWPVGTPISNTIPGGNVTSGGSGILQGNPPGTTSPTVARLTQTKTTAPASIYQGQTALTTITLTDNDYTDLTAAAIDDTPIYAATGANEVVIADSPGATTTCAGSPVFTAVPGSTSFRVSGLTLPQRGSCRVSFYVKGVVPGVYTNTIPAAAVSATTNDGSTITAAAPASASLTVQSAITAAKSFAPASVASSNGSSRVTITLNNVSSSQLTGVALSDPLPTGMVLAATPQATTSCGGSASLAATPGSALVTLAGATLYAGASCVVQFNVETNGLGGASLTNTLAKGAITADGGVSNATPVSGTLTTFAAPSINIQKSFSPASLTMIGQRSLLTITLGNTQAGAIPVTNLSLTDTMPAGIIVVAGTPATTNCPGGVVATPGNAAVSLSGASLGAGATCTITAQTSLLGQGTSTNTIPAGAVHTDQSVTNASGFSSNLSALPSLGITKDFSPSTVAPGVPSTLTIHVLNSEAVALTNISVSDALPAGLVVATPSGATTTCRGGTVTTAGNVIQLTGGVISEAKAAPAECIIQVNVVAALAGNYDNLIHVGDASGTSSTGSTATNLVDAPATLHVQNTATLTKSFANAHVDVGQVNRLTVRISNPNAVTLNNAVLTDTLPVGVYVAQTPNVATTCAPSSGSTVVVAPLPGPGGQAVRLTGAQIPAAGSCTFSVDVLSNLVGTFVNTIPDGALTTDEGVTNAAPTSASFSTFSPPTLAKQFTPVQIAAGGNSKLRIVLGNPNPSAITLTAALTDTLPQSPGALTASLDAVTADALPRCAGASSTATTITVANGTSIPPGGCVVIASVTGATDGTYTNVIPGSALQTNAGPNQIPATAQLLISSTLVSVTGYVYADNNANGSYDAGDVPLPGQTLQLVSNDGLISLTTTTSAGGDYAFVGLPVGTYRVTQPSQPAGTLNGITSAGRIAGATVGSASGVATTPSTIGGIAFSAGGQIGAGYNFGEVVPSSIAGQVFADANNDGIRQAAEPGIAGTPVTLNGVDDTGTSVSRSATSAADGTYAFTGLRPGQYTLIEGPQPAGTVNGITSAGPVYTTGGITTAPGSSPGTATAVNVLVNPPAQTSRIGSSVAAGNGAGSLTLPPNAYSPANNFAEVPATGLLSGSVFVDNNADDTLNGADAGVVNQPVRLTGTDLNGTSVTRTTTTAADGSYAFNGLAPGVYAVSYTPTAIAPNLVPGRAVAGTTGGSGGSTPATALSITAIPISAAAPGLNSQGNRFTLVPQKIDVVKAAGAPLQVGPKVYQVPFILTVGNQGTVPVTNVQVADNLLATAPTAATISIRPGSFAANLPGSAAQCAGPATTYDGIAHATLLAGNFPLAPGEKCVVGFVMVVDFGAGAVPAILYNSAYASTNSGSNPGPTFDASGHKTGDAPNTLSTDISVNAAVAPGAAGQVPGTAPALPGTANGDAAGGVPTPVSLTGVLIDAIKNAGAPVQVAPIVAGHVRFEIPYAVTVAASQQAAPNLQVVDSLAAAYAAGSPSVSVKAGSFSVPNGAPSAGVCAGPATPYDGVSSVALLAGNFTLPQGSQCTIRFTAVVDYPSAAAVPTAATENLAFAVAGLQSNPTGGSVSGTGSGASFTPAAGSAFIALDTSSGNRAAMGGTAQGATVFSTSGGQSGATGPVTVPSPTVGTQQLPASPNGDNSGSPTTQVVLAPARLSLIKAVGVLRQLSATTYQVPYTLVVKNTAAVPASNVQLIDNLQRTFNGSGAPGITIQVSNYTATPAFDAPATSAPSCTAAAYDGVSQPALLAGTATLLPGQKCVLSFVATVAWTGQPLPVSAQLNQAVAASGTSPQVPGSGNLPIVPTNPALPSVFPASTLASVASTNAVPTTAGSPGAPPALAALPPLNPNDPPSPTPALIAPAFLDVVKSVVGTPAVVDASTFDIGYALTVKNTGPSPVYNVQLNDTLRTTFATPASRQPALTNGGTGSLPVVVRLAAGHCTVASAFDGVASSALLAGTDNLQPGESCTLTFTVRVHYAQVADVPNGTAQLNTAYASSTVAGSGPNPGYTFPGGGPAAPPAGAIATDLSSNGTTPPATPNGDVPAPTPVLLSSGPDLVLRKSHAAAFFTESNVGVYTLVAGNRGYLPTVGTYSVVDTLPAGMTVAAVPTGSGWNCAATTIGSTTATCTSSAVIAGGAGTTIDNPAPITLTVNVRRGACAHPNAAGQCSGSTALVNHAQISGGGEQNIPFFTANNVADDPTSVQQSGAVSGQVWTDLSHDRQPAGNPGVAGMVVEVLDSTGTVVASATTDSSGHYLIGGLAPGPGYQVRFRDQATGAFFGRPVSRDPVGGNDPTAAQGSGVVANGMIQNITVPGANGVLTNQSLPLDPGGIVYDSVTRRPVAGAVVTLIDPTGHAVAAACVVAGVSQVTTKVTGSPLDGSYSFLLQHPVPAGCPGAGHYQLRITPPAQYTASRTLPPAAGTLTPPLGCANGGAANLCVVQFQAGPPVGAEPTTYYLSLALDPATPGPNIVGNNVPLDPAVLPALLLVKTGDRTEAELGATIRYSVTVSRTDTAGGVLNTLTVVDTLPQGFRFVPGTAALDGKPIADPAGAPGPRLAFTLRPAAGLAAGGRLVLTYRVRLGVGSQQGTGINSAQAMLGPQLSCRAQPAACSNVGQFRVKVTAGVFATDACITGKVYVDCNHNHVQDAEELGIPGVRIYLENGQYFITDVEGKYSYCGLPPLTHVAVVDPLTLPKGSRLMESSNRNAGDPTSLFLDLRTGSLDRADFIEGSCSNTVLEQVKARRAAGAVSVNQNERTGRAPLRYDGKGAAYPQEGTDSANQPIVKTRESAPAPALTPAPARAVDGNDAPVIPMPAPAAPEVPR